MRALVPVFFLGFLLGLPASSCTTSTPGQPEHAGVAHAEAEDAFDRGARLYDAHCAVCHGYLGEGDGPAAPFLFPEPRDFTRGRFRLVRTEGRAPTDADLVSTLRRGIPGSAMPAWDWFPEEDLEALAVFVRDLAEEGLSIRLFREGRPADEAVRIAHERLAPGAELPRVAEVAPTEEVLAAGRATFLAHCATCHGEDGSGRDEPRFDEDGSLNWPRDLTAGYLKGGRSAAELGWRVQAGIPGTAMPGIDAGEEELEELVAYLRHLIPAEAEENLVHTRGTVRARRVEAVASEPDDPAWDSAVETPVVLAPLHAGRRRAGVTRAFLSAQHDGERVAVRVRWPDETGNLRIFSDLAEPDGCALQFTADAVPRYFGMGARDSRSNIWHWKALRLTEVAGSLELLDRIPHVFAETFSGDVRTDVPVYRPRRSLPSVSNTVDSLHASGVGRLGDPWPDAVTSIEARPLWSEGSEGSEGGWTVVFTRSCAPEVAGEVPLEPGATCNVAVAVWDGSAGDRGARKSISIWQALELEP